MTGVASLDTFLKSGQLGPLSVGMTLPEVERLLGEPEDEKIFREDGGDRRYWVYGRLEIFFDVAPAHRISWFQIDHFSELTQVGCRFGRRLKLAMDGYAANTPPSTFIRRSGNRAAQSEIQLHRSTSDWEARLYFGDLIEMHFATSHPSIAPASRRDEIRRPGQLALHAIDNHSIIDSIYAYPAESGRTQRLHMREMYPSDPCEWMDGNLYLDRLDAGM
jgi:hypothetical protein